MVLNICTLFLILVALAHLVLTDDALDADVFNYEGVLRRHVFDNYDKTVRPVKKYSSAVPVQVSMTPLTLRSMNEDDQIITLDTWVKMSWTDENLQWNPSEYGNISLLHVSPTQIWIPDVSVYTATPDSALFPKILTNVLLYNTGVVLWVPPFTISSRCPIPFGKYVEPPRSFVECNIRLGSWTYNGKLLDLQLDSDKVDLTNFQDYNHDWKLLKIVQNRESRKYPCCPEEYPLVHFNVTLRRRSHMRTA